MVTHPANPARTDLFSSRFRDFPRLNPLTRLLRSRQESGREILDLTVTNPTAVGLEFPPRPWGDALADPGIHRYQPAAGGTAMARQVVAGYYRDRGWELPARRILLTASTSEAYSCLFKLLSDPGGAILVPRPSYPLFDHLAQLESLQCLAYPLRCDDHWRIDMERLREQLSRESVRALILVQPNNPTGSMVAPDQWREVRAACMARGKPVILDEVFFDFRFAEGPCLRLDLEAEVPLFILNGLSKAAALPQIKASWIGVVGPQAVVRDSIERLELILDTYLSVSTPAQLILEAALPRRRERAAVVSQRLQSNLQLLRSRLAPSAVQLLEPEGGWSAVLRLPGTRGEEEWVLHLLDRHGVLLHPGYFYDFQEEVCVVLSLLTPPAILAEAVGRLIQEAEA